MNRLALLIILSLIPLAPAAAQDKETFTFSGRRTEAVLAEGKEHTILSGNAVIVSDTRRISADRIDIYGKEFTLSVCTGNVTVEDEQNGTRLRAEKLSYDRKTEIITVEGYSELEDTKNELIAKCGYLRENGGDKITIMQIGVKLLKVADGELMSCRAEHAVYDRGRDTLELNGMPRVDWKGDRYEAARITINLETDEIKLEGNVRGTITSE